MSAATSPGRSRRAGKITGKNVNPVEKVLAESARAHLLLQVMVRSNDHTNIHARGSGAADALHLTLFEDAQKLSLHHGWHVANLIQKQRSPVSLLELADVPRSRARKRSLLMPE